MPTWRLLAHRISDLAVSVTICNLYYATRDGVQHFFSCGCFVSQVPSFEVLPVFEDLLLDRVRLGLILREARDSVGLTVRDVAARVGLTNSHISKIELGQIQVSADTFVRVCLALSLPPGLILESCVLVSRGIHEASAYNDPAVLEMASKSGRVDYALRETIADFIAGSALLASYLLKSSAPQNLLDRIDFPIPPQKECFRGLVKEVESGMLPIERNEILVHLVTDCYRTLTKMGLLRKEFVTDYVVLCSEENRGFSLPWVPLPKPPFYGDTLPTPNPLASDIHVLISNLKRDRRVKAARKKELTKASHLIESGGDMKTEPQWPVLKMRLQKAMEQTGARAALVKVLKVDPTQISQWLSDSKSAREPGGEYTLQLLKWVELQERQTK